MKIFIKVQARSKIEKVEPQDSQNFKVHVHASPEKGKANSAVLEILAKHFKIPKSRIRIVCGHSSSHKIIEII